MRCKCGYNSFDHNLTCPKCHKDLSVIRRQLNLTMPSPGMVNFFQTAGQRGVFPEPVLGQEVADDPLAVDPFASQSFNNTAAFGAAGAYAGGMPGFAAGPGQQPAYPHAPAPLIDDLLPAEDDIDDIAPIDDYDDIAPMEVAVAPGYPVAPAPAPPQPPQGYPAAPVPPPYPQAPPSPAFAGAPQFPQAPAAPPSFAAPVPDLPQQATGMAALAPDLADDEIEIEIDALDDSPVAEGPALAPQAAPVAPAPEAAPPLAAAAMDQIKDTLAEAGDLAFEALDNAFHPAEAVPAAPAPPQPRSADELSALADEINLDDLDSEL